MRYAKLSTVSSLILAMSVSAVLHAEERNPDERAMQDTGPAMSSDKSVTPGTANPAPSTQLAEGTAADSTAPGETATRQADPGTVNPAPATSRVEGTAADSSPPGETPVRGTAASQAPDEVTTRMARAETTAPGEHQQHAPRRGSELIGMDVVDARGQRIGRVEDVVLSEEGRITHGVIAHQDGAAGSESFVAIPWSELRGMARGEQLVIDQQQLARAPAFGKGEWPTFDSSDWSAAADGYWADRRAQP